MDYSQAPATPQQQDRPAGTNKAFAGRLTKDPHQFTTRNGNQGVNLEFAVDVALSDGTQGVEFCKATYYGTDHKLAADFLKKGDPISGTGKQYLNHFTRQDGTPGSQIVYDGLTLLFTASQVMNLIIRIVDAKIEKLGGFATQPAQQQQQTPSVQQQTPPVTQQQQQQYAPPVTPNAAPPVHQQQQFTQQPNAATQGQPTGDTGPTLSITSDDLPF